MGAEMVKSSVILSFDDKNKYHFNKEFIDKILNPQYKKLTIVGVARGGKSTFINLLCSYLSNSKCQPFETGQSDDHISVGITGVIIANYVIIDCQGIKLYDGSMDKILLFVCHYLSDIIIYNTAKILDNTIFNNLTQMAAFTGLVKDGRSTPPQLIFRVADSSYDEERFVEQDVLKKLLDISYDDDCKSMRSAFHNLFSEKSIICTDSVGKSELKMVVADPLQFLKNNESFHIAMKRIVDMLKDCKTKNQLTYLTLYQLTQDIDVGDIGIKTKDLDALSAAMGKAMNEYVLTYSHCAQPINPTREAIEERIKMANGALNTFDEKYRKVNEYDRIKARNNLLKLLIPSLHTAWTTTINSTASSNLMRTSEATSFTYSFTENWNLIVSGDKFSYGRGSNENFSWVNSMAFLMYTGLDKAMEDAKKKVRIYTEKEVAAKQIELDKISAEINKIRKQAAKDHHAAAKNNAASWYQKFKKSILESVNYGYPNFQQKMIMDIDAIYPKNFSKTHSFTIKFIFRADQIMPTVDVQYAAIDGAQQKNTLPDSFKTLTIDTDAITKDIVKDRQTEYDSKIITFNEPMAGLVKDQFDAIEKMLNTFFQREIVIIHVADIKLADKSEYRTFIATFRGSKACKQLEKTIGTKGTRFEFVYVPSRDDLWGNIFLSCDARVNLAEIRSNLKDFGIFYTTLNSD